MKKLQIINKLSAFAVVSIFFSLNITAQEIQVTKTEKPSMFKLSGGKDDQIIEPSAIESIDQNGKHFLVIDDKSEPESPQNLRVVNAKGELMARFVVPDAPQKPKWEAITKDEEGFFYLIGSHAADDADKLAKRSHLYRFRLKMNADPSKIDVDANTPIIEFDIKPSLMELKIYTDIPSEKTVKIEGLAVKSICGKKNLVFGLREPSDYVEIYSAELPPESEIKKGTIIKLSLKPYFRFDAQTTKDKTKFKLSSIEYVPNWNGFLILTSSETTVKAANEKDKPVFHGNTVWFVGDEQIKAAQPPNFSESIKPAVVQTVPEFESSMKAEGFCLLPTADKNIARLAIVYDNDTEDLKKAAADKMLFGMMQFIELTHQKP